MVYRPSGSVSFVASVIFLSTVPACVDTSEFSGTWVRARAGQCRRVSDRESVGVCECGLPVTDRDSWTVFTFPCKVSVPLGRTGTVETSGVVVTGACLASTSLCRADAVGMSTGMSGRDTGSICRCVWTQCQIPLSRAGAVGAYVVPNPLAPNKRNGVSASVNRVSDPVPPRGGPSETE